MTVFVELIAPHNEPAGVVDHFVVPVGRLVEEVVVIEVFDDVVGARSVERLGHADVAIGAIDRAMTCGALSIWDIARACEGGRLVGHRLERRQVLRGEERYGQSAQGRYGHEAGDERRAASLRLD